MNSADLNFLKKLPIKVDVQSFTSSDDAFQALLAGKIDATVTNKFVAKQLLAQNPTAKLQIGELLWKNQHGIAVAKGNKELKNAVDAALKELMRNGTYKQISEKYFNEDIRC